MMDLLRSLILGVVQGLTEFLPISSSGHLELINQWVGSNQALDSDLLMIVLVHFGTACSILYVYRRDVVRMIRQLHRPDLEDGKWAWMIALSMVPAGVIGLAFETALDRLFSGTILYVGCFLIFTGLVLQFTPRKQKRSGSLGYPSALAIGFAQAVAILPGISRSGMTIAAALFLGIDKERAARFSFLMVLPLIFAKVLLDLLSGEIAVESGNAGAIAVALISSFVVGIWACKWMINLVKRSKIHYFAYYCMVLGTVTIIIALYVPGN